VVDPQTQREPFSLGPARAERGVLLVHGFTGSPFEMYFLGERLAARGFAVAGPRLAGHGGATADLARTRWPDWYATVSDALDALRARAERVAVCGLSLGGLLTLELARNRPRDVRAISVLSTALWLTRAAELFDAAYFRITKRVPLIARAVLPKLAGSDIADPIMKRANGIAQGGAGMPLGSLHSLIEFGRHVRARLGEVRTPALVVHGRRDHTVPIACMDAIVRGLGARAEDVETLVLERSFHCITLDVEREALFGTIADFFERRT
jgi:carboxylesterase